MYTLKANKLDDKEIEILLSCAHARTRLDLDSSRVISMIEEIQAARAKKDTCMWCLSTSREDHKSGMHPFETAAMLKESISRLHAALPSVDPAESVPLQAARLIADLRDQLGDQLARLAADRKPIESSPVPMILTCPACNSRHIDEGEFATKPHHTHACQGCGMVWRPALVPTVGVQFLPGFKNGGV